MVRTPPSEEIIGKAVKPYVPPPWVQKEAPGLPPPGMPPPVIPKIEEPKLPVPKETWFTGPEFQKVFGISLPTGWDASYIWDEAYTTPVFTVYTPEGKKLELKDIGISPTGEWTYGIERREASLQEQLMQDPGYWERIREWEALQGIFGKVFPQEDVEQLLKEMATSKEAMDAFQQSLRDIGRTEDTEELLTRMFPEITPEQLNELLGPRMILEKLPEATAVDLLLQTWGLKPIKETLGYKAAQSFLTGIGDVLIAGGGVARALGYDEVGEGLSSTGLSLQKNVPPYTLGEFDFWDLLNPEFYAVKITRAIPFALSLAPLAIGGFYAGSAVATAAGLGTIASWIIGGFAGAALSRPAESAFEAGGAYDDAIARGKTETEAKEEFDKIFWDNMWLAGADAWEIGIALAPTPKWVPLRLVKSRLVRTVTVGGKMVIVGLSEGGEEIYQDFILRRARGEEWQWDPISKEVFAIGMVMGLGMGFGGDVISSIVNTSKETMPPAMKGDFERITAELVEQGFTAEQAELRALDIIARTPEGESIVAKAIEGVKKIIAEERGAIGRPEEEGVPEVKVLDMGQEITTLAGITAKKEGADLLVLYREGEAIGNLQFERVGRDKSGVNLRWTDPKTGEKKAIHFVGATEESIMPQIDILVAKHIYKEALPKPPVVPEVGERLTPLPNETKAEFVERNLKGIGAQRAGNRSILKTMYDRAKRLEREAKPPVVKEVKPLPSLPTVTTEEATTKLAISGKPALTLAQADKTLSLFGEYIENPSAENAWELTRELRRETLADRAGNLKARSQQLIIEEGMAPEDAIKQATRETMSGELPVAKTDYLSDLTQEMRDALFSKVYHTLKNEPLEMMSTTEALANALLGKAIPREPGIKGGSAYSRLMRVFNDQPPVFKAITKVAREHKKLEDIVEGIFRETGRAPIPVDEEMANYLRGLPSDVIYAPTEFREPIPVTRYEAPIEDAAKQMPMFPRTALDKVVSVLKEIAWAPVDIGNFLRANKASFDFSFWRQQGPMIINHPIGFVRANIASWNATWSQKAAEGSYERITRSSLNQIYEEYVNRTGRGDFLRPIELVKGTEQWKGLEEYGSPTFERLIPRLVMKIPWIKLSARGFATGCNEHNWRIYEKHYEAMLRLQEKYASGEIKLKPFEVFSVEKEMGALSEMLTDFTQRATLGKLKGLAPVLNSMFFAPRATLGRFLTPRHLLSSNPRIRMEAFRNLSTFVCGIGGIVLLGELLDLWEVEKDPHNAEYMSIRIGNIRVDPWAGYRQFLVFYTRIITGTGISSVTGIEYVADPIRSMTSFVRGKASPFASLILDFWTGKNFIGEEVDVKNVRQWLERMSPFSIWDVYESYVLEPAKAAWIILPAILGAGVQAYTGEWIDNFHKLGIPKYTENLPYGVAEPIYDVKDFWSDTSGRFRGVDPATLTEDKGFPPYIRAIAEARIIKEHLSTLPNQSLVSLNTDSAKGATFADYYRMWQDREKIVLSGDKEALKAFDTDERTRSAHLGNFSQQQFSLLNQYYAITDIGEQTEFLLKHKDEIGVNLRKAWLESHPKENAQLAVWGQVDVLSQAAYDEARRLIDEFDIPHIAVDEYLPPKDVGDPYFEYLELLIKGLSPSSPEVKLFRMEHPELNNWGMDNLGWGSTVAWKGMDYYKLEIELADKDAQYDALKTTEERVDFLDENSEYATDRRRRDALNLQIPEELIDKYAEYYKMPIAGYEQERFLMENEDYYNEVWLGVLDNKPKDFTKVPSVEVEALYEQWQRKDLGKDRRRFEAKYPELDMWLHLTTGTMLETDR